MSVIRAIAVFLCGLSWTACRAQILFPGACPDVAAMSDFDPSRYLGKWYEAEKYFAAFELGGTCITANYKLKDNGAISVVNEQFSLLTGTKKSITGEAVQVSRSEPAKLSVTFSSLPVNIPAPYWIVSTDYDSYALIWSCYDFGIFHTRNAWILTRQRKPSASVLDEAYSAADKNNINRSYFMRTDQTNCSEDS
ncbi:apolipoprotein D-like isoform X2 [Danaus plexippus]|nr:apolipoprotein D-like isoform X2 [Danaus plexippus]